MNGQWTKLIKLPPIVSNSYLFIKKFIVFFHTNLSSVTTSLAVTFLWPLNKEKSPFHSLSGCKHCRMSALPCLDPRPLHCGWKLLGQLSQEKQKIKVFSLREGCVKSERHYVYLQLRNTSFPPSHGVKWLNDTSLPWWMLSSHTWCFPHEVKHLSTEF